MNEKVLKYDEIKGNYSEIQFDEPVKQDTYRAVISYCNEKNITLDSFCKIALKRLSDDDI